MAEAFSMSFTGVVETGSELKEWMRDQRQKVADLLYAEAVRLMDLAKARCPVKRGLLRDSGKVFEAVVTDNEISVTMSFGDEVVKWAVPVHERTYVQHMTGQSKYLESVILENADTFFQNIGQGLHQ